MKRRQLGLADRRQGVHFVEEKRAVLGGRHQPFAFVARAREGAGDVAEQLVLEELRAEPAAVYRDERRLEPPAALVQITRIQLFADSAGAGDQHLDVRAGHLG